MPQKSLRIVTFNFNPIAYQTVRNWIQQAGHKHILAVTTPGPETRPTPSYLQVIENTPRDVDVLVTTRMKSVATPVIRALKPDIILCFSFPYRIPPELCSIPTHGAVNLHPALLPAYRGPNVLRPFYEGDPIYGATAHWIAEEYDTGNILSQKSEPMPETVTHETFSQWFELMGETIAEGMERAIAGDVGEAQDDTQATYAAPFTKDEEWLDWQEPKQVLQRKSIALNMFKAGSAKARIAGEKFRIHEIDALDSNSTEQPGTIIEQSGQSIVMQVADGQVRAMGEPFEE